jgi:hypothetical protein
MRNAEGTVALFDVAGRDPAIQALVDQLAPEASKAYEEARLLFVRHEPSEDEPKPRSWAELYLKDVRDRTFHYPKVGSFELRDALMSACGVQARVRHEKSPPSGLSSSPTSSPCTLPSATSTSRTPANTSRTSSRPPSSSPRCWCRSA